MGRYIKRYVPNGIDWQQKQKLSELNVVDPVGQFIDLFHLDFDFAFETVHFLVHLRICFFHCIFINEMQSLLVHQRFSAH